MLVVSCSLYVGTLFPGFRIRDQHVIGPRQATSAEYPYKCRLHMLRYVSST